jgi:lipopolysaccharide transport system ATP-binding protein
MNHHIPPDRAHGGDGHQYGNQAHGKAFENKVPIEFIEVGQKITLKISITAYENLPSIVLGYLIKDRLGQSVYGTNTYYLDQKISNLQKDNSYEYFFTFHANIGEGSYSISVGVHRDENHIDKNYDWQDLATTFNIINGAYKKFIGVNWLPPVLECNK